MKVIISETRDIKSEEIIRLYKANNWSSAEKPTELYNALINSDSLITAWDKEKLIGIGNAISDGHLQMLTADGKAIDFYRKVGFEKAGNTQPMWIYKGNEH